MSKKTSVVLIFIGILVGLIGSSMIIPVGNIVLPVGTIASIIFLFIGCIGLYKNTSIKKLVTAIVFLCIYAALNVLMIIRLSGINYNEMMELYLQLLQTENATLAKEMLNLLIDVLDKMDAVVAIGLVSLIPYMIFNLNLARSLYYTSETSELSSRLIKNGKKAAIFTFIGAVAASLGSLILLQGIGPVIEEIMIALEELSNNPNAIPTIDQNVLSSIFLSYVFIIPASVFAIIGLVAQIKYIVAIGKLIGECNNPPINNIIDNDYSNGISSINNSSNNNNVNNILDDIMGNNNSSNNSSGNSYADSILDDFVGNNNSSSNEDDESKPIE